MDCIVDCRGNQVLEHFNVLIDQGWIDGPRIFTAGKSLATTGGHADPTSGYRHDLMGNPGPEDGVLNGVDNLGDPLPDSAIASEEKGRHLLSGGAGDIRLTTINEVIEKNAAG